MINTDKKLIFADLTYKVRGAVFSVYNELGYGHKEQIYQKALAKEFDNLKIRYEREKHLSVRYQGRIVGSYQPDFVVEGRLILELKAVELMPKTYATQLLHYLKTTGYQLGLLINFGKPKLETRRLIWTR